MVLSLSLLELVTRCKKNVAISQKRLSGYLTIIRRRRSEYWWIFPETKSRGIFTNIHEPEANNCFSIITQVIIEIPKQRNQILSLSRVSEQLRSHGQHTISLVKSAVFPPDWDVKLWQTFIHLVDLHCLKFSGKFGLLLKPFCWINYLTCGQRQFISHMTVTNSKADSLLWFSVHYKYIFF